MISKYWLGIVQGLFAAFLAALITLVVKFSKATEHAVLANMLQNIVTLFVLTAFNLKLPQQALRSRKLPIHLVRAAAGTLLYVCYFKAIGMIHPLSANLLINAAPIFSPFLAWVLLGSPLKLSTIGACFIGFIGLGVVLNPGIEGFAQPLGIVYGLIAAVCFSFIIVLVKKLRITESVPEIMFNYSLWSLICSFIIWCFFLQNDTPVTSLQILQFMGLGLIYVTQVYSINHAISNIGPVQAGLLIYFSVLFLIIINLIFGWGVVKPTDIIGGLLIVLSAFLASK